MFLNSLLISEHEPADTHQDQTPERREQDVLHERLGHRHFRAGTEISTLEKTGDMKQVGSPDRHHHQTISERDQIGPEGQYKQEY